MERQCCVTCLGVGLRLDTPMGEAGRHEYLGAAPCFRQSPPSLLTLSRPSCPSAVPSSPFTPPFASFSPFFAWTPTSHRYVHPSKELLPLNALLHAQVLDLCKSRIPARTVRVQGPYALLGHRQVLVVPPPRPGRACLAAWWWQGCWWWQRYARSWQRWTCCM
jgi:hypothetical protein